MPRRRAAAEEEEDCNYVEPVQASSVRKGGYAMLKGNHPCRIVDFCTSKEGKHGPAKVHFTGFDLFTGKKIEDMHPSKSTVYVPLVSKKDFQLANYDEEEGRATIIDEAGVLRRELACAEEVRAKLSGLEEDADVVCTVLSAMGNERVVNCKVK
mmetsp:Transcript_74461/g.174770  ORF Transcript_74461/g.174770 Transcript_74461/m.174770 type:complete len:154 (-) Transcript_74461:52-513(-)